MSEPIDGISSSFSIHSLVSLYRGSFLGLFFFLDSFSCGLPCSTASSSSFGSIPISSVCISSDSVFCLSSIVSSVEASVVRVFDAFFGFFLDPFSGGRARRGFRNRLQSIAAATET